MWQSIIKAWGNKLIDPGGDTRRKRGELNVSIRYILFFGMTFCCCCCEFEVSNSIVIRKIKPKVRKYLRKSFNYIRKKSSSI